MTISHTKKRVPVNWWNTIKPGIQINCIDPPRTAEIGAIIRSRPPTRYWYTEASMSARPAAENPATPVNQRTPEIDSWTDSAASPPPGNAIASTIASKPETTVTRPEMPKSAGTMGVARRSRIIHVRERYQAATASVTPDASRPAPLKA